MIGFSADESTQTLTPAAGEPAAAARPRVRTAGLAAGQVEDDGLHALPRRRGVGPPRPAEVAERSHGFPGKVVGGEPVVVHDGEGQAGEAVSVVFGADVAARHRGGDQGTRGGRGADRRRRDSQVKELVEDGVQRLQLDLRALTLGRGEEVVRTQLHDDKGVAQTCGGGTGVRPKPSRQNAATLPLASSAMMSAACRISTVSLCSGAS